jgi:hypothetical protein
VSTFAGVDVRENKVDSTWYESLGSRLSDRLSEEGMSKHRVN